MYNGTTLNVEFTIISTVLLVSNVMMSIAMTLLFEFQTKSEIHYFLLLHVDSISNLGQLNLSLDRKTRLTPMHWTS